MTDLLDGAKASLREQTRSRLEALTAVERVAASTRLCVRLKEQGIWRAARSVLFFAPRPDEPDLWPVLHEAIAAGMSVSLPSFDPETNQYVARQLVDPVNQIVAGKFGIREPAESCTAVPLNRLDLALVPGVAFDARGARLGRGRGFYDRLLTNVRGSKCGVAFEEQIVDAVPVGPLDIRLNCILTPTRWIET